MCVSRVVTVEPGKPTGRGSDNHPLIFSTWSRFSVAGIVTGGMLLRVTLYWVIWHSMDWIQRNFDPNLGIRSLFRGS